MTRWRAEDITTMPALNICQGASEFIWGAPVALGPWAGPPLGLSLSLSLYIYIYSRALTAARATAPSQAIKTTRIAFLLDSPEILDSAEWERSKNSVRNVIVWLGKPGTCHQTVENTEFDDVQK